jgi:hypothetical protein
MTYEFAISTLVAQLSTVLLSLDLRIHGRRVEVELPRIVWLQGDGLKFDHEVATQLEMALLNKEK